MTNKVINEKIENLINDFLDEMQSGYSDETEFDSDLGCNACFSGSEEEAHKFLYKLGVILEQKTLIKLFKQPKSLEEILKDLADDDCKFSPHNYEEFEEIEVIKELCDDGKYTFATKIIKYTPSGKFYSFTTQRGNDQYEVDFGTSFNGEVTKKEIVTTEWS